VDDLASHRKIAASGIATRVFPAFRPDKALNVNLPEAFNPWVDRLAAASNVDIGNFTQFVDALRQRHDYFHSIAARVSDRGLHHCHSSFCSTVTAAGIFDRARRGQAASPEEREQFASNMMLLFGQLDAEKGWTKQLHLGAYRSANTRRFHELGPDTGF